MRKPRPGRSTLRTQEVADLWIKVTVVEPGPIATEFATSSSS